MIGFGHELFEIFGGQRFGEEDGSSSLVDGVDPFLVVEVADCCPKNFGERRMVVFPVKEVETVEAGHAQIEKYDAGQRVLGSICEQADAFEIRDGLCTAANDENGVFEI